MTGGAGARGATAHQRRALSLSSPRRPCCSLLPCLFSSLPPFNYPLLSSPSHCLHTHLKTKRNGGGTVDIGTGGREATAGLDRTARSDAGTLPTLGKAGDGAISPFDGRDSAPVPYRCARSDVGDSRRGLGHGCEGLRRCATLRGHSRIKKEIKASMRR